jgi:hypothetical protein
LILQLKLNQFKMVAVVSHNSKEDPQQENLVVRMLPGIRVQLINLIRHGEEHLQINQVHAAATGVVRETVHHLETANSSL